MNENQPEKMPPVPPFVRFVASAVPMVFDDSLSYYEALCALWKYVQGMTDVINNNATLEEEYIEKFNELKSFVDNYFNNLDVQEEINNKLDQMAEDGTLQEIMADYIQLLTTWTFNTVADMKASTNLINGSFAATLGYYAVNDGGGATYYITDTGTADEGNVVAVGDSLYANLVKDHVNVKQYGAYGDDTHDDSVALQLAIDSNTDGELTFNEGTYLCDTTINVSENIKIKAYNAKIHSTADTGVLIGNESKVIKVYIDDLAVERSEYDDTTDNYGFRFIRCYESVFTNLYAKEFVYNFYINPQTAGFGYNVFNNISGVHGKINLLISANTGTSGWANQNIFYGGRFVTSENTVYNIKLENGDSNEFYAPCCEGSGTSAILCDGTQNIFEYPRTEGTWSSTYGFTFDSNSQANRLLGLRYDLHLVDNGTNNTWWNQYDGIRAVTGRTAGQVAKFTRNAPSSNNAGDPIVSVEDMGTSGTTTLLKIVEKDTNINHRPLSVFTKGGEERFYINGYGDVHAHHSLNVDTISAGVIPLKLGASAIYYKNNIIYSSWLGDKSDEVPVGHDYKSYAGDPNGHVTPTFIGDECLDTTNSAWYKATGTANNSWAKITA